MSLVWTKGAMLALFMLPSILQGFFKAYSTGSSSQVSVINADTKRFIKAFIPSLGELSAGNLQGIAISSDQSTAYIVDAGCKGLWVIRTMDESVLDFIALELLDTPLQVKLSLDDSKLYIADRGNGVIWVVHTEDRSVTSITGGATKPAGLAFNPEGTKLYVSDSWFLGGHTLYVYSTEDDSFITTLGVSGAINFLAVNSSGIGYGPEATSGTITVFNTATDTVLDPITTLGNFLEGVAFSEDGQTAYVASNGDKTLQVIQEGVVADPISLTNSPWQVTLHPSDNQRVYVTTSDLGGILVIDDGALIDSSDLAANIDAANYMAYIERFSPEPALSLVASARRDRFLFQTDTIHRLTWNPSESLGVVGYTITRNGTPIAVVSARGPLAYEDHNRSPGELDHYQLRAVNEGGDESDPISITITSPL